MTRNVQRGVALVTGAVSGIGRAAAGEFTRRGYTAALVDMDKEAGPEVEAELREFGDCAFFHCDITDDAAVEETVSLIVERYGRLDAAFNAAGIDGEHGKNTAEGSLENWNRVIAVDLTGTWSCMRYEIPAIIESGGGSIVNCASVAGLRAAPTVSAYTAAKHGVIGLTRVAAAEYGRQGVRINAVCPGTVDTPMFRRSMSPEIIEQLVAANPVGRVAQPNEIAAVAVWLCDEAPGFLTGETITVDGGFCA
ncbi:short-chain dehydrogenase [Mycolicibacterium wolinskyi]|uniref:Short-chain dehydrogenase n=1 Tax=Mycolicibacterium wolinskyi TaxID=59750 RepID=A0A132PDL7_9MYCO|nr:SDR family oxidoreductase [Mycolicibacterium wolinskyi]KWX20052.1 short-chain dehydrogenase [Mycolicibacterium wolinskyi]